MKDRDKEKLINLAHLFLCKKVHEDEIEKLNNTDCDVCNFYLEKSMADKWERPGHMEWVALADILMRDLEAIDYNEAVEKLKELVLSVRTINELTPKGGGAAEIAKQLL